MMYSDENQKMKDMKAAFSEKNMNYRMATVTTIYAGRPIIRFYGEGKDSLKKYKYISSYSPVAGDQVLLIRISGTYIILGKVV